MAPNPASGVGERDLRPTMVPCCLLPLVLLIFVAAGCTPATVPREQDPTPATDIRVYRADGIRIRPIGARWVGDAGTPIKDPGWTEYILAIDNTGGEPLTIYNVKLLNRDGRYLDSARSYEQVTSPPTVASGVAGDLATSAAGVAAGQVVPFGGTIVGLVSRAISASSIESKGNAKRAFDLRKLKAVELAPGGKVTGSAFLPRVINAKALVVDYGHGNDRERIEIQLSPGI